MYKNLRAIAIGCFCLSHSS